MRSLKALLVLDSLDLGGAERHAIDLALALHRRGHSVTVACTSGGPLCATLERDGIDVRVLGDRVVKRRLDIGYARNVQLLVREGSFQLVHSHMYASGAAAALATAGTGVAFVHTEHSEAVWRSDLACRVGHWTYRTASHVVCVSHLIRQRLVDRDGICPTRLTVIPNAVTESSTSRQPRAPTASPIVGVVSRLCPEKGIDVLLEAAARLFPCFSQCRLEIIGDGPARGDLEVLARSLRIDHRVRFVGERIDARDALCRFDVLAVPSRTEGTPLVVLEAMAAAVPIVATCVGGIPDQIRQGREGLLVPPEDAVALCNALLHLLLNPEYARRLGEAGRRRSSDVFRHDEMVDRIEGIYGEAVREGGARSLLRQWPSGLVA